MDVTLEGARTVMRNVRKNDWKMNIEERKVEEKLTGIIGAHFDVIYYIFPHFLGIFV